MTLTTADLDRAHTGGMDEINPSARPRRRTFSAADKRAYLDEYDALPKGSSERGAFLRREGLYSSHLSEWRKQRDNGALAGLEAKPRTDRRPAGGVELDRSRRQVARLEAELQRNRLALEIMGKAHALLELISESADTEKRSKR
jgi:transposase